MFSKFKDSFNAGLAQAGVDAARRNQSPRNSTSADRPTAAAVALAASGSVETKSGSGVEFDATHLDADSEGEDAPEETPMTGSTTGKAVHIGTTDATRASLDDVARAPAAPADLRKKLRKLDKYEEKYPELLAAFRGLQAQAAQTAQFETVLRDLTPATTVADVEAFQGWAHNFTLKTEMSMAELRRVSDALQEAKQAQAHAEARCKDLEAATVASTAPQSAPNAAEVATARIAELEARLATAAETETTLKTRIETLETQQARAREDRETAVGLVSDELAACRKQVVELRVAHAQVLRQQQAPSPSPKIADAVSGMTPEEPSAAEEPLTKSQKKRRNKKKGPTPTISTEENTKVTETLTHPPPQLKQLKETSIPTHADQSLDALQSQLDRLQAEADTFAAERAGFERRLKRQTEDEHEEVQGLREMLANVGSELVEARDQIKDLKVKLTTAADTGEVARLTKQVTDQEVTIVNLKAELARTAKELEMAERLAAERFKELTAVGERASKQAADLADTKTQLAKGTSEKQALEARVKVSETRVKALERSERDRKDEVASLKTSLGSRERELKVIQTAFKEEEARRKAEEARATTIKAELAKISALRESMAAARDEAVKQAAAARQELTAGAAKVQEMQALRNKMVQERDAAQEQLAQRQAAFDEAGEQASALREQTADMQHQMREAVERLEACEEELTESQRLLGERARETSTMRRLLSEMEASQAGRLREMRERMEQASAERDKAEDEAAFLGKKRAREVEELKEQVSDAERTRRRALAERDELAQQLASLERAKASAEQLAKERETDLADLKKSSKALSTTLQDSERQVTQLEAERQTLQRQVKETQARLEGLQSQMQAKEDLVARLNRERGDWADAMSPLARRHNPGRSESFMGLPLSPGSPMRSPSLHSVQLSDRPKEKAEVDREYIKNVLFQFLEHKERRAMLVPVISRLLLLTKQQESVFASGFR